MNRLLDVWDTLLSFSKYFLSNTISQNIDNFNVAFSLLFSIYVYICVLITLLQLYYKANCQQLCIFM